MGVPKKRKTHASTRQRRAHDFLTAPLLAKCKNCGQSVKPHVACANCGFYKGKKVK